MNVNDPTGTAQLLARMRAAAAEARSETPAPAREAGGVDFSTALTQAIERVNADKLHASAQAEAFERGEDVSLVDVMVSMQRSRVSGEALKQVRNRLLEAYQEVMRMSV